jgi:hypothetical protein
MLPSGKNLHSSNFASMKRHYGLKSGTNSSFLKPARTCPPLMFIGETLHLNAAHEEEEKS